MSLISVEQVGARVVDRRARTRPASSVRLPSALSASSFARISSELSGVRSSCDMFARNSDLYFERERELLRLLLERAAGDLDLAVLDLDPRFCSSSSCAFSSSSSFVCCSSSCWSWSSSSDARSVFACSSSSRVRPLQLVLLRLQLLRLALQLLRQRLRLLQQLLGPHVRDDRVEHDADRLRELVEERWWISLNGMNEASSITAITCSSNRTGITMMFAGRRLAEARTRS